MKKSYIKRLSKIHDTLSAAADAVTEIKDDLESEFEDKSEKWQESEAGEAARQDIDNLENWIGEIENARDGYQGDLTE